MPRQKKPDPFQEQRRRCVLAIANEKMAAGEAVDRAIDSAFAICTRQLQRTGYLKPSSATPTAKGATRSVEKLLAPQAQSKRLEYEALLAAARTMRASRKKQKRKVKPINLDGIIADVMGGIDLDAILTEVTGVGLRGAANVLPLPGSRNADLCRELTKLREGMDEVFRCDTAFGDCRIEEGYPSAGHCMLAAMVVQDLFGGEIMFGQVGGVPHYWNRMRDRDVDVTGDQFGESPVRAKRGELNGGGVVFDRTPGKALMMPVNAELMGLHERFVKRLTVVLRRQGQATWAKLLAAQQGQRKAAA